MLDRDLAELYGVETRVLNQGVKRNSERFPEDFLFRLTAQEKEKVVTNCDHLSDLKFAPSLPLAFTEHGAIMAATVLNSERAVAASVFVVRAFVKLREAVMSITAIEKKLTALELKVTSHDGDIKTLIAAIRQLMTPPEPKKKSRMGF